MTYSFKQFAGQTTRVAMPELSGMSRLRSGHGPIPGSSRRWIWNRERRSAPADLSIPFHQVLVDRCHFRIFIRLCRRLRHKETDVDYQHQGAPGQNADHSFPRGRPHRAVSFRRRCSLSLIILFKFAIGRISIGPSPYLKPGSCETS